MLTLFICFSPFFIIAGSALPVSLGSFWIENVYFCYSFFSIGATPSLIDSASMPLFLSTINDAASAVLVDAASALLVDAPSLVLVDAASALLVDAIM